MDKPDSVATLMQTRPTEGIAASPVSPSVVEDILAVARRAPSGVNTQPWNVVVLRDQARAGLVAQAVAAVPGLVQDAAQQAAFWNQFNQHPGTSHWPALDPAHAGDAWLSAAMARINGDPARARRELERYFRFFDAPVGLVFTISRSLGVGSVLDYGMFLQNITLAARARGIRAVLQTGWRGFAGTVLRHIDAPQDVLLVAGMALGYPDPAQPAIEATVHVPPVESFTTWHA